VKSAMSDTEDLDLEPHIGEGQSLATIKTRRSLSKLRRELSDDELTSPAVQRLLIDEIERLDRQVSDLETYRRGFYETEKRAAVLEQKVSVSRSSEIIFAVCLCVGAAALGYAPSLWSHQPSGYLSIAFGAILIIGGAISRFVRQ